MAVLEPVAAAQEAGHDGGFLGGGDVIRPANVSLRPRKRGSAGLAGQVGRRSGVRALAQG